MGGIVGILVLALILASSVLVVSKIGASAYEETDVAINETLEAVDESAYVEIADVDDYRDCRLVVSKITNDTEAGAEITTDHYTLSGCGVQAIAESPFIDEDWVLIGTATYDADSVATDITDDTNEALGDIPDWLPLLIILLVVIIVMGLVALIIISVRKAGLLGGGEL